MIKTTKFVAPANGLKNAQSAGKYARLWNPPQATRIPKHAPPETVPRGVGQAAPNSGVKAGPMARRRG